MAVHYKFASSKDFDTVMFDGSFITVAELKRAIFQQKKLGKSPDVDLVLTNASTKEEYRDEGYLVPKNTSVIARRVPLATTLMANFTAKQEKQAAIRLAAEQQAAQEARPSIDNCKPVVSPIDDDFGAPIYAEKPSAESKEPAANANGASSAADELALIQGLVNQPPAAGAAVSSGPSFPRGGGMQMGAPPPMMPRPSMPGMEGKIPPASYICHRCNTAGHYIRDCPTNGDSTFDVHRAKRPTGIPRSFLKPVESGSTATGGLLMPGGGLAVMTSDEKNFKQVVAAVSQGASRLPTKKADVPADLKCPLCLSLLQDAVLIPCCGTSFCDSCVRNALVESSDFTCPSKDCQKTGQLPDQLVPNKAVRNNVETYRLGLGAVNDRAKSRSPQPAGHSPRGDKEQGPNGTASEAAEDMPNVPGGINDIIAEAENETGYVEEPEPADARADDTSKPSEGRSHGRSEGGRQVRSDSGRRSDSGHGEGRRGGGKGKDRSCFKCGDPNHIARDCPNVPPYNGGYGGRGYQPQNGYHDRGHMHRSMPMPGYPPHDPGYGYGYDMPYGAPAPFLSREEFEYMQMQRRGGRRPRSRSPPSHRRRRDRSVSRSRSRSPVRSHGRSRRRSDVRSPDRRRGKSDDGHKVRKSSHKRRHEAMGDPKREDGDAGEKGGAPDDDDEFADRSRSKKHRRDASERTESSPAARDEWDEQPTENGTSTPIENGASPQNPPTPSFDTAESEEKPEMQPEEKPEKRRKSEKSKKEKKKSSKSKHDKERSRDKRSSSHRHKDEAESERSVSPTSPHYRDKHKSRK